MPTIICTVTNDLSQDQRMIRICRSLQGAGYEVTLVGRQQPHSLPLVERSFRQERLACWAQAGKLFYLEHNLRLLWYLFWRKPDIVNAVDLDTLLPGYLVTRWRGGTCVYDAHEYFTEVPEVVRRPPVQRAWSALADWVIPRLEYAYTVGPGLAAIMSKRYGIPFGVVRNLPLRREQSSPPSATSGPKVILYQGMLNEGRGLATAILALKQIRERTNYELVLWLAGHGDVQADLEELVRAEGLEDQVRFLGFISPEELPELTAQAWLGLNLLANTGLSYYYSLANKTFDYIQAGLPALHANFPEYRALQEQYDTFLLVNDLDVELVAAAIKSLLDDPERYTQLVAHNRAAATDLIWEREEAVLLAIYHKESLKE
jgi:glycosyltransferase involved in cell wall biosynthesis